MRRVSVFAEKSSSTEIMMTPLIDCVFLLLVFFLWTSSFRIPEQSLPGRVQSLVGTAPAPISEPPPPEADFDEIIVRVLYANRELTWTMNDRPMESLRQLRSQLQRIADINRQAPVIVHPDPETPLGHVIDTYDAVRLEGLRVAFAASAGTEAVQSVESNP